MNNLATFLLSSCLFLIISLAIATDFTNLANLANLRYGEGARKSIYDLQTL